MLLAIQLLGVCLIAASLLAGAGWWHLALSWWRGSGIPVVRQARWTVEITPRGLYIDREYRYAYAYA